jgi:hypothetical protein
MKFIITLCIFLLINNEIINDCSVIILGGSTSSLSAAISSAEENVKTCLIEPTDWLTILYNPRLGGQITNEAVPAIDLPHHTIREGNQTYEVWRYGNLLPST